MYTFIYVHIYNMYIYIYYMYIHMCVSLAIAGSSNQHTAAACRLRGESPKRSQQQTVISWSRAGPKGWDGL